MTQQPSAASGADPASDDVTPARPPTNIAPAASTAGAVLGVLASLVAGSSVSIQSRVNGELGVQMGDPYAAGLVSFGSGLVLCVLAAALIPSGRRGLARLPGLVRHREIPWWYLIAGVLGAFLVAVQTQVTVLLGVSVFILGLVVGQAVGGLVVDRLGLGPGGVQRVSGYRLAGTLIIIVAVFVAMFPRFAVGLDGISPLTVALLALLPVAAGIGSAVQTGWNAGVAHHTGTPIVSTLTNFTAGTLALAITEVIAGQLRGTWPWRWPEQWWLYTGGIAGIVFIAAAAVLAKRVGVLQTGLGMVTGMLLGALVLDVALPTPTSLVTPITVLGTLCTLIGLVVVTLPWKRAPGFVRSTTRRR